MKISKKEIKKRLYTLTEATDSKQNNNKISSTLSQSATPLPKILNTQPSTSHTPFQRYSIQPMQTVNPMINQMPMPISMPSISYPPISNNNNHQSYPNLDFTSEESGENIQVCLRIRPLNLTEKGRNDTKCLEVKSSNQLIYSNKSVHRNYSFNLILNEESTQEDVFYNCSINKLLDDAMDGYSVTIFAYGQTGSGKTYTIMGREDSIDEKVLSNDKFSGLMPKSVKYIWSAVRNKAEKFYIKVSFLEIYNEQINDLLNPGNVNLQIRWDQKQGFFVEGLLVIECKNPNDIVEVILQGTKNRKRGTHELNKDSSRSHCILTVYIISEFKSGNEGFKKYGKVSFVDLAGSERLKETKSHGGMLKETGNINRSLFVLGKVISTLTDKKNSSQHIPYRDSKLTMLLMDSIGGTSKTLMIACVSSSSVYADEIMNTMNYATRAMNIKNKPLIQMDGKERSAVALKAENASYKIENDFFKNEFMKLFGTLPSIQSGGFSDEEIERLKMQFYGNRDMSEDMLRMQDELSDVKKQKEQVERQNTNLINENMILNAKLTNLETVFIGGSIIRNKDGSVTNDIGENYNLSSVMLENKELKKTIDKLEIDKIELKEIIVKTQNPGEQIRNERIGFEGLQEHNNKLSRRVEFLQKRERELLETIMKLKMDSIASNK